MAESDSVRIEAFGPFGERSLQKNLRFINCRVQSPIGPLKGWFIGPFGERSLQEFGERFLQGMGFTVCMGQDRIGIWKNNYLRSFKKSMDHIHRYHSCGNHIIINILLDQLILDGLVIL